MFRMNFDLLKDKETWRKVGKFGVRLGKAVVVDGLKAQAYKGAKVLITTGFEEGMEGIKKIGVDDVLGKEEIKVKSPKKKWWSKKDKEKEIEEVLDEIGATIDWQEYEVIEPDTIDAIIVEDK